MRLLLPMVWWGCVPAPPSSPPPPDPIPPDEPVGLEIPPTTRVLSFQWHNQPDPGYDGIIDTTIREDFPTTNYGTVDPFFVEDASGARKSALLAWDISLVPPGSQVVGVDVTLKVAQTAPGDQDLYPVLRDWTYNLTTWDCAYLDGYGGCPEPWEIPGALGTSDRGLRVGTIATDALGWSTATLTEVGLDAVQGWVDIPSTNHGFLIEGTGDQAALRSNDVPEPADRPILTVEFVPAAAACPGYAALEHGTLDVDVQPVSGLVAARRDENPGVLFAAAEDGAATSLWAVDRDGTVLRTFDIEQAPGDWEGLAVGPAPDDSAPHLFLADMGDQGADRTLRVLRLREPDVATADAQLAVDVLEGAFPPWDANGIGRALLIDPADADLYLVTDARVYRWPDGWQDGFHELYIAQDLAVVHSDADLSAAGVPGSEHAAWQILRSGTFARDGSWLAVRTEREVWLYLRGPGEDVFALLGRQPDCTWAAPDPGGRALSLDPNGQDLLTLGPGPRPVVHRWLHTW